MTNVLILRVPDAEGGDLIDIRDYILESLERGVLILGQGVSWEVAQLPDLGGVALAAEPDALEAPVLPAVTFTGSGRRTGWAAWRPWPSRTGPPSTTSGPPSPARSCPWRSGGGSAPPWTGWGTGRGRGEPMGKVVLMLALLVFGITFYIVYQILKGR